jgi:hypothetical protein
VALYAAKGDITGIGVNKVLEVIHGELEDLKKDNEAILTC